MNKKIASILVGFCISLLAMTSLSEAQPMNEQALTARQQGIVVIAALTANGELEKLKTALNDGLDAGLTVNEIKEVLVQMYAYTGFPRSLNGLGTFMAVMDDRQQKGIKDELGKDASPLPADKSRLELGEKIQTELVGAPVSGRIFTFAPAIDAFLKDHLFGDIFGRDNLDFQSREIATIAALASMKGVDAQLQAHLNIGFNVGLTEAQLRSLVLLLAAKIGGEEADNANEVLNRTLSGRAK